MRSTHLLLSIVFCALLQGCASSYYKPGSGGGFGYYERMIHEDYYEVSYLGDKNVSHEMAYDYAVLRALEIGKNLGFEYMLVDSAQDSTKSRSSRSCVSHKGSILDGTLECAEYMTFRATLPGYKIIVRYSDEPPMGRYLPEKLFLIRSSYIALQHKYGIDK